MKPLKDKLSLEQDQRVLDWLRFVAIPFTMEHWLDRQITYPLSDIFHENIADTLSNWMWSDLYEASF